MHSYKTARYSSPVYPYFLIHSSRLTSGWKTSAGMDLVHVDSVWQSMKWLCTATEALLQSWPTFGFSQKPAICLHLFNRYEDLILMKWDSGQVRVTSEVGLRHAATWCSVFTPETNNAIWVFCCYNLRWHGLRLLISKVRCIHRHKMGIKTDHCNTKYIKNSLVI